MPLTAHSLVGALVTAIRRWAEEMFRMEGRRDVEEREPGD
jgi:hypothetical protein